MSFAARIADLESQEQEWWDLSKEKIPKNEIELLVEKVKTSKMIRYLDLAGAVLGSDGARGLAEGLFDNGCIVELYLSSNGIRAEGAKALAISLQENTTLRKLDLDDNGVGNEGAKAFANCLKVNTTLRSLYLGALKSKARATKGSLQQTYICDAGDRTICEAGAKVLAEMLKVNRTLAELTLGGHKNLSEEGVIALCDGLQDNFVLQELDLIDCDLPESLVERVEQLLDRNAKHKASDRSQATTSSPNKQVVTQAAPLKSCMKSSKGKASGKQFLKTLSLPVA